MNKNMVYGPLCKIHEINKALDEYEASISKLYGVSLHEGMLLCCLKRNGTLSSSKIAEYMELTPSNASKVIKTAENKRLIIRTLNTVDKRVMLFSITDVGETKVKDITSDTDIIPDILKKLVDK